MKRILLPQPSTKEMYVPSFIRLSLFKRKHSWLITFADAYELNEKIL